MKSHRTLVSYQNKLCINKLCKSSDRIGQYVMKREVQMLRSVLSMKKIFLKTSVELLDKTEYGML